ncbi:MAG TPA: BTAD domain-containing putative transcriptional regulator [Gemmatimonadales bacterium]
MPPSGFRLETFGGLTLAGGAASGLSRQRRRQAFLALLAASGDRGLTRDQLLGYLWSESAAGAARHSLEQLIHVLRRELGESAFIGTDPLRLNDAVVASDVVEFERALANGRPAEAVAVYRGPFLSGFYLDDAPEFERWAESERARLAARHAGALERLASEASVAGDHAGATRWWRQLAEVDPLSSRAAMGFIRALAASGDLGAALQYARQYESTVRRELESAPDPAVTVYVAQLRAEAEPGIPFKGVPRPSGGLSRPPPSPQDQIATPALSPAATFRYRLRYRLVGFAAVAGVVLAGTWVARRVAESSSRVAVDPNRVLVVPFRVTSADSSLLYLREGMVDLLATRLTGEGGPVAVDPRTALGAWRRATAAAGGGDVPQDALVRIARGLGAGQLLLGEVVVTPPDQIIVSARVVASADGRTGASASVTGRTRPADSLLALIDQLGSTLLALRAGEDQRRLASLTSTSLPALRAFLQGRTESRLGHDASARRYFARALDYDSTFALAAVEWALARGWLFRWTTFGVDSIIRTRGIQFGGGAPTSSSELDQWDRAMELAWRGRNRLNRADRALLLALRGERHPDPSFAREMLAHWEQAVRAAPDRPEAHYTLGSVLLSQGLAIGLADSRARARASFQHALELDSAFLSPITGLVEIAALERDTATLRRLQARYLAQDSLAEEAEYVRWLGAAVRRDETALRTIRSRFADLDLGILVRIARTSQMLGIALEDAERAISVVLGRTHERNQRQIVLWYAGFLALNRGQPDRTLQLMRLKREVDPNSGLFHGYALRYALWWDGDSLAGTSAARAFESSLSPSARGSPQARDLGLLAYRSFSLALWRLWHGDTTGAAEAVELHRRGGRVPQAVLLEALLAGTLKRPEAVATLARLDSTALLGCCTLPQFINLVSARLHERAGDLPGALAAVRRGRGLFPPQYLSTYLREEGRLAALTADTVGAIAAYRHYLTLRSNPEPSLQPAVDSVRTELARLERRRS